MRISWPDSTSLATARFAQHLYARLRSKRLSEPSRSCARAARNPAWNCLPVPGDEEWALSSPAYAIARQGRMRFGTSWPASVRCRGWSRVVESRLAEWRRLLRSSTTQDARSCNECSEDASLFAHGGRSRLQVRCRDPFRQAVLWSRGSETDVDQSLVRGQGSNRTTGHLSTAIGEGFWPKRRTDTRKTALTVQGLVGLQGLTWNQIQPFLRDLEALRGAA